MKQKSSYDWLEQNRKAIARIDERIILALVERMAYAKVIGDKKRKSGLPILCEAIEDTNLTILCDLAAKYGLRKEFIIALYQIMFAEATRTQLKNQSKITRKDQGH